jgi:hypothetical protein
MNEPTTVIIDFMTVLVKWEEVMNKYPIFNQYPIHDFIADVLTSEDLIWDVIDEWAAESSPMVNDVIIELCRDLVIDIANVKRGYFTDPLLQFKMRYHRWVNVTAVALVNIDVTGVSI